jgi:phage-related protein
VAEKPLIWVGSAREDLRAFPEEVRRRAGFELFLVQSGLMPSDWKAMPKVGPGVVEIRIRTDEEHRVFYVAKYEEAVYVLHAFQKKTQKTSTRDLELGKNRLKQVVVERSQKKGDRK